MRIPSSRIMATLLVVAAAAPVFAQDGAGLSEAFQYPAYPSPTGTIRDVTKSPYNAIPGDANNDATAIQAAITASSAGDTVYLPNGSYRIASTLTLKTGVSLIGESEAGVTIGTIFPGTTSLIAIKTNAANGDLVISNFTLYYVSGANIKECIRIGAPGTTITERVKLEHLTLRDLDEKGIELRSTRFALVQHCTIGDALVFDDGGSGYAIDIEGVQDLLNDQSSYSNNNWIHCNTIMKMNTPRDYSCRHGILLGYWVNHNLIENNYLSETKYDSIDLHGENEHHNEIRYNTIVNCARSAIGIGNPCSTGCGHDNAGPYNWVHHNVISGSQRGVEVMLGTDNTYIEYNTITDLTRWVSDETRGIHVQLISTAPPGAEDAGANTGTFIRGNIIHGAEIGIELQDAPATKIMENQIYSNTTNGILVVSNSADWIATHNYVACNGTGSTGDEIVYGANTPAQFFSNTTTCAGATPTPLPTPPDCGGQSMILITEATYDGDTTQSSEGSSTGGSYSNSSTMRVGDSSADRAFRGVLSFDTATALPDTASVEDISLKLFKSPSGTGDPWGTLGTQVVEIGTPNLSADGDNINAGDWQAAVTTLPQIVVPNPGAADSVEVAFPAVAATRISKTARTQMKLRFTTDDDDDTTEDFVRWITGDGTAGKRAELTLDYITATPTPTPALVTLDLVSSATYDGDVSQSSEGSSTGGSVQTTGVTNRVGDSTSNRQQRGFLHFDTASIPDTATIVSVQLTLNKSSIAGDPWGTLGTQVLDIGNSLFGAAADLVSSDWEASAAASAVVAIPNPGAASTVTVDFPTTAFPYISKTVATQFRLRFTTEDDNDLVEDNVRWNSGDNATASKRPLLRVVYIP